MRPCKLFLLGVGVHVDERKGKTRGREKLVRSHPILESRKENRLQLQASVGGGVRGALFYPWQGLAGGLKRAPHIGSIQSRKPAVISLEA